MNSGELVYDADCSFCSRFANWAGRSVPWQDLDLAAAGDTVTQVMSAAGWLEDGRIVAWGTPAIAAALVQRGGVAGAAGRALRLPVVRLAADVVYRGVAANRHLMPGGTDACRVRQAGPRRRVMVAAYVGILLAGLLSLAAANRGSEPYPALIMPGFGTVPESGGAVTSTEAVYTLVSSDGSTRAIDPADLLPAGNTGYVAALRTLSNESATRDPETVAWLRGRLPADVDQLRIDWHTVRYDTTTRKRTDTGIARTVTIDLGGAR